MELLGFLIRMFAAIILGFVAICIAIFVVIAVFAILQLFWWFFLIIFVVAFIFHLLSPK